MAKKSQQDRIRALLLKGRSITPMTAFFRFGCLRLSARIWDLRKEGMKIITDRETRGDRQYARYRLDPEWLDEYLLSRRGRV